MEVVFAVFDSPSPVNRLLHPKTVRRLYDRVRGVLIVRLENGDEVSIPLEVSREGLRLTGLPRLYGKEDEPEYGLEGIAVAGFKVLITVTDPEGNPKDLVVEF
jgi:hypothetical protein